MSKERLEEFREFIDFMYESIDIEDHQRFIAISESMIKDGWFKWIYRYAKEQAKRVQELEGVLKIYRKRYSRLCDESDSEIIKLQEQNKRYRELIESTLIEMEGDMDYYKDNETYDWSRYDEIKGFYGYLTEKYEALESEE